MNLILHRSKSGLLVDVEELGVTHLGSFTAHQRVRLTMERLHAATDMVAMSQLVVEEVFKTTGHTRVMMYKFHEDMHGEVVAECKAAEEAESWLGLHFPATDLPQRSRDELAREHVRLIADAQAPPLNPLDVWVWEVMAANDMLGAALATRMPLVMTNDMPGGQGSVRESQGRVV